MHGGGNFGNTISARASEIYNNTIKSQYKRNGNVIDASTVDSDLYFGIVIRGGESLVYNNYLTNYRWGVYLWLENQTPGAYPGSYPVIHQTGYLSGLKYGYTDIEYTGDHGDGDVFAWNNTLTNTWTSHVLNFIENETDDLNFIKFGRDFQTVQKPGYVAYPSPHPYKNYYYSFVNNFMNNLSNLSATNIASTSVRLNWDDVLCEDGYYIYQSTNGVDFVRVDSTGLNEVSHVISGLSGNTQYWFYVKAYNDNHESLRSNITTFTTPI
jgi:hypothetical protein